MKRHALFGMLAALCTSFAFEGCGGMKGKDSESHFLDDGALDTRSVSDGRVGTGGADAGVAGESGDSSASGGSANTGGTAEGGMGGSAQDASASGASGGSSASDSGPSGPCDLDNAWFAMMTEMPASYGQQLGMWDAAFTGKIRLLALIHVNAGSDAGATVHPVDLRICGMQIPDFTIPDFMIASLGWNGNAAQLSTMEVYGITFPNSVWDNWTMDPTYAMRGTLSAAGTIPGDSISLSELALPLGAWSYGPLDLADWPNIYGTDYAKFINGSFDPWEQVDMDQDGHPGITGFAKTGPVPADSAVYAAQSSNTNLIAQIDAVSSYSLPLGDTTTDRYRASEIYFGIRAITNPSLQYAANLTSCDVLEGSLTGRAFEHHTVGCWQASGAGAPRDCAGLTTATFDDWIPQFALGAATFTAKRLPYPLPAALTDPAACTLTRQAFATVFPP